MRVPIEGGWFPTLQAEVWYLDSSSTSSTTLLSCSDGATINISFWGCEMTYVYSLHCTPNTTGHEVSVSISISEQTEGQASIMSDEYEYALLFYLSVELGINRANI